MRLVIEYSAGDGCTYSCTVTHPVEYESAEALIVDFEEACRATMKSGSWDFTFAGHEFAARDFFGENGYLGSRNETFYPPEILTVDEWFKRA